MSDVINIAAYKFFPLADLQALRERLRAQCKLWKLRGTILLSPEGINLFVAGGRAEIDLLLLELRAIPGLEELQPKVSVSEQQPFNRMLVRIKREIIAFGVPGIEPGLRTSPKACSRRNSSDGSTRGGRSRCSIRATITKSNSARSRMP